ncbi:MULTISPECIES: DUF2336 domain-containing protein [unclassified Minwuia]|jgi:uncharacterized protein (DUF2336 family)|uniref:DUF2336 domain-containing protein n=1 Tax=unclassified Minwuia TaxID=2618799 RepID=UPI00247A409D|nr:MULTISPECIES: DUF2336 domain-containing protein [unclassified Minwuia]
MTAQIDVSEVQRLIGALSADNKTTVAAQVGRLMKSSGLSPRELRVALELVDQLVADSVVAVRQSLAEHIAESPMLPRPMIERLIADVDAVALPIVRLSSLLDDAVLLEQLERGEDYQVAVAGRESVSAVVSERIVSVGTEQAVGTLVRNTGADLQAGALDRAIDRFQESTHVMGAVAARPGLPLKTAERLVSLVVSEQCIRTVSDMMMDALVKRSDLPPILAEDIFVHGMERSVASVIRNSDDIAEVQELAARMKAQGRLSTSLMLRVLAGGDHQFFIAGMTALSGWPEQRVKGAMDGAGLDGFRRLYEASGLDSLMFHAFRVSRDEIAAARKRREGMDEPTFIHRIISRISDEYSNISPTGLEEVLARLRRRADGSGGASRARA